MGRSHGGSSQGMPTCRASRVGGAQATVFPCRSRVLGQNPVECGLKSTFERRTTSRRGWVSRLSTLGFDGPRSRHSSRHFSDQAPKRRVVRGSGADEGGVVARERHRGGVAVVGL